MSSTGEQPARARQLRRPVLHHPLQVALETSGREDDVGSAEIAPRSAAQVPHTDAYDAPVLQ